jgi:hypothetical protein
MKPRGNRPTRPTLSIDDMTRQKRKMALNDPFGRHTRRNHRQYEMFREKLTQQGIDDTTGLDRFARRVSTMARNLAVMATVTAAAAASIMPGIAAPIAVAAAIVLIWLGTSYLQTHAMIRRYREEPRFQVPQTESKPDQNPIQEDPK